MLSRNKREGHYYGWVKGRHIRAHIWERDVDYVSSWYAFREYTARKYGYK